MQFVLREPAHGATPSERADVVVRPNGDAGVFGNADRRPPATLKDRTVALDVTA